MILGFCHDDPRFSVRRGLMIGLATADFEGKFVSLYDTVHGIMKRYAPMRIAEIKRHMANARDVLDVSILGILRNSPDFVLAGPGTYDLITRTIGNKHATGKLTHAIEIALIDHETSVQVLMARLSAVGIKYQLPTIISYLAKLSHITSTRGMFKLERPSAEVAAYNRHFRDLYSKEKNIPRLKERLARNLTGDAKIALMRLDYRLAIEPSARTTPKH